MDYSHVLALDISATLRPDRLGHVILREPIYDEARDELRASNQPRSGGAVEHFPKPFLQRLRARKLDLLDQLPKHFGLLG